MSGEVAQCATSFRKAERKVEQCNVFPKSGAQSRAVKTYFRKVERKVEQSKRLCFFRFEVKRKVDYFSFSFRFFVFSLFPRSSSICESDAKSGVFLVSSLLFFPFREVFLPFSFSFKCPGKSGCTTILETKLPSSVQSRAVPAQSLFHLPLRSRASALRTAGRERAALPFHRWSVEEALFFAVCSIRFDTISSCVRKEEKKRSS